MKSVIREVSRISVAPLVPEIRLHLITEACALWHASEEEARRAGLVEPWWAFAWPGGQALARYVLDHPETVRGKRVLDFGSGCAIEGIAAALAGAATVIAADIDSMAGMAAAENAALNGVSLEISSEDWIGKQPDADVILAGDVFYDRELAARALAWLRSLDALVLIGDPSRGFLDPTALDRVATYRAGPDGDLSGTTARETAVYRL